MKRLISIGDIHGKILPLERLINAISLTSDDTVVFMGDYIDRGKHSFEVIELIIDLMANSPAKVVALRGNHEDMMIRSLINKDSSDQEFWQHNWFNNGGFDTLDSYHDNKHKLTPDLIKKYGFQTIPDSHIDFLLNLDKYYETDKFIFSHATPYHTDDMNEQSDDALYWKRPNKNDKLDGYFHKSGKMMVNGHTPIQSKPTLFGNLLLVDTGAAYSGGLLTAFDLLSMSYTQANEHGEVFSHYLS